MDRYALIINGRVSNVIEQDTDPNQLLIGWTQPPVVEPVDPPEPVYDEDGNVIPPEPMPEPEPFVPQPIYGPNPDRWVLCGNAGPGWLYDEESGEFSPPPAAPIDTRITVLAAINRFTEDEWLDIDLFSINDPSLTAAQRRVQAKVRLFMLKLTTARYVDLLDPAVADGLNGLVAAQLLTSERAGDILNTPAAPHELWASNTAMRSAEEDQ